MPGGSEFWNNNESAFDYPMQRDIIIVNQGDTVTGTDIILNSQFPAFDQYEDDGTLRPPALRLSTETEVLPA
jgi:hypothetical protein